jgi:hypothetical protein
MCEVIFEKESRLKIIEDRAFLSSGLRRIAIPKNVEIIGSSSFFGCKELTEVVFEENKCLREIGAHAFNSCGIAKIVIPSSVESIGNCAFVFCRNLSNIEFEKGSVLRRVGVRAFFQIGIPLTRIKFPPSYVSSFPKVPSPQEYAASKRGEINGRIPGN